MGHIGFKEPFARLFTQGMIVKDGAKMSKSKGNTVSPDKLINKYGADTVRFYTLFIGPPEKDAEWNDRGVEGAWRFLNRVWKLVDRFSALDSRFSGDENQISRLKRKTHLTIKKITEDMEGVFHFNTALSAIMELVNEIYQTPGQRANGPTGNDYKKAIDTVIILLAPFVPHIAEEMWEKTGNEKSVFEAEWPGYDKDALVQDEITMPVQINGKVRTKIEVASGTTDDEIKNIVLGNPVINKWTQGKPPKKVIVVKGRLVNLVV